MDIAETLLQLYAEKAKLERAITALEELRAARTSTGVRADSPRGRKSMGAEEREEVSRRMKRYWANRRRQR